MKKVTKFFLWSMTVLFAVSGLVYMPSFASILYFALAVATAPIEKIQSVIRSKVPKFWHIVLVIVLFFVSTNITPIPDVPEPIHTEDEVVVDDTNNVESQPEVATEEPAEVKSEEPADKAEVKEDPKKEELPPAVPTNTEPEKPTEKTPESTPTVKAPQLTDIPSYNGNAYVTINNNQPFFTAADKKTESFEKYSSLDALGRCGVAFANIGTDIMPTEERGAIGSVKPSGWQTIRYDFIDGRYLYNRCHLIGYQLSGENANEQNLITGTRYLNMEGMLPFENQVADYVERTNNHVLYRVTPMFDGQNLLASGVLMEAQSVEDDDLSFCVFCYNVQPGIVINYANGENYAEDGSAPYGTVEYEEQQKAKEEPKQEPEPEPEVVTPVSEPEPEPVDSMVWVSKSGKKYHSNSSCSNMKNPSEISKSEAESRGRTPCSKCY